jgi:protein SCO1/2
MTIYPIFKKPSPIIKSEIAVFYVFPETDSVLLTYAKKNQVNDAKWNLVTGDKKIYMARKSYLAVKLGQVNYDMVHTENFVLVDTKKRVRGFMTEQTKKTSNDLSKTLLF